MGGIAEKDERRPNRKEPRARPQQRCAPIVNQDAFTLIELLVVIAIIALLMAILSAVLSRVRKQAKAMICQGRLRQWGMVLAAYTEANQGRFPARAANPVGGLWLLRGAFIGDKDLNVPQDSFHHFHTRDIACCPAATRPFGYGTFGATGRGNSYESSYKVHGTSGSVFGAWEITTPAPAFRGSYGLNSYLFQGFREFPFDVPNLGRGGRLDLDVLFLRGRAQIPVLLDAVAPFAIPFARDAPPTTAEGFSVEGIRSFCMNRHTGRVNGLFLDWSVRPVGLKELWTLKWSHEFNTAGRWTKAGGVQAEQWPKWMRALRDY